MLNNGATLFRDLTVLPLGRTSHQLSAVVGFSSRGIPNLERSH